MFSICLPDIWRTVDGKLLPVPKRRRETEILGEHQIENCPLYLNCHKEAEILGGYQIEICFLYLMIFSIETLLQTADPRMAIINAHKVL